MTWHFLLEGVGEPQGYPAASWASSKFTLGVQKKGERILRPPFSLKVDGIYDDFEVWECGF